MDLQKKHSNDETSPLISIQKTVIPNNARHVGSGHIDDVRAFTVGEKLAGPCECGVQESSVVNARCSALQCQESIMKRQDVALIDPDRFGHSASTCNVLR